VDVLGDEQRRPSRVSGRTSEEYIAGMQQAIENARRQSGNTQ
jgi:hypothetical protein